MYLQYQEVILVLCYITSVLVIIKVPAIDSETDQCYQHITSISVTNNSQAPYCM